MNTTFENNLKFAVSAVLAALITLVIASGINNTANLDLSGKTFVASQTSQQAIARTAG